GVEAIRGVNCEAVLDSLERRGLVAEVGRQDTPGHPRLFGTTLRFLEVVGLERVEDLPPLPEGTVIPELPAERWEEEPAPLPEVGMLVDPVRDGVAIDGRPVPPEVERRTLMLNKPLGVVTTRRDPGGRPTVLDLVEDATGLFPVGRLDADSRGLLLLTTDGEL